MKKGDRCTLVNPVELEYAGIKSKCGREVILLEKTGDGWNFRCVTDPDAIVWWAPDQCFQLEQQERKNDNGMSHYREGDRCRLMDKSSLSRVSMGSHLDKHCTLKRKLSYDEIHSRISLDYFKNEEVWWVEVDGLSTMCYVPFRCLLMLPNQDPKPLTPYDSYELAGQSEIDKAKQCGCWYGHCKEQKEPNNMYLHTVTIVKTPSILAQQAGEVSKIIVPQTEVMAANVSSATAQVAAMNAEKILALKDQMSTIQVFCKMVAGQ